MRRKRAFLTLPLLLILALALFWGSASAQQPVLTAVKVDKAPVIDGQADALWNSAKPVSIPVSGGTNLDKGQTMVNLSAVYTEDSIYFLAQWNDPTQSSRRSPWQKQADGTWKKLSTSTVSDENTYYEDKFAMIWNINDSIKGFAEQGCFATCHAGEAGKAFGNKYTASPGEIGDIWHWKSVRTNPVGQTDDQYVDDTRYDKDKAPEAGRKSDPKTSGGYSDNQTDDKKAPKFGAAGQKPAPPYWILDSAKQSLDDGKYKANDEVAGIIVSAFVGDRGDIPSEGVYKDGKWTLEIGRKLNTGSKFDVQFTDLIKPYYFGVAVFDNAQVRHAYQSGAAKLAFSVAALPKTGESLPVSWILIGSAAAGLAILGLGAALRRRTT